MRLYTLILTSILFFSCRSEQIERYVSENSHILYDIIRANSKAADILFYRDFASSKISILAGQFTTAQGIDSVLSYFGDESLDTECSIFSEGNPIGQILFYRDTSRSQLVAGFDFTLAKHCKGFYDGIENSSFKISMSSSGQKSLEELHKKVKSYWEK